MALEVDLGDAGGVVGQERPIVAHEDDAGVGVAEEPAQALEAVEVEVVGRLVQEEDVEAGQQHGGQVDLHLLAAGELRHRPVHSVGRDAEVGQHLGDPHVVVVAAEGQQPGQGGVVGGKLRRARRPFQRRQRGVEGRLRSGQAGTAPEVSGRRLAVEGVDLLGQVADGQRSRGPLHRPRRRGLETGQDAQERRFPGAVAAQDPDAAARVDRQVDPVEHQTRAAHHRHIAGCEHRLRLKEGRPAGDRPTGGQWRRAR
jgi:hypothetical protein